MSNPVKNLTYNEYFGIEKSKKIRELRSNSVKESWQYRQPIPHCDKCGNWLSKIKEHKCVNLKNIKRKPRLFLSPIHKQRIRLGNTGKKCTEETKQKLREKNLGKKHSVESIEKRKGKTPWNKNLTKEIDERIQKASIKRSKSMLQNWQNKDFQEKQLNAILNYKPPSSYEKKLISIIEKHKLPYKFVGDGKCFIGGKVPDFININGKKIVVELYDNSQKTLWFGSVENYQKERKTIFEKYGWVTIFLDENDLKSESIICKKLGE